MKEYDVIIVGGGPGGYAAAVSAREAGLKTAVVEKELLGGVCVNFGCVPTKALVRYAAVHKRAKGGPAPSFKEASVESRKVAGERSEHIHALLRELGCDLYNQEGRLTGEGKVALSPSGEVIRGRNILLATGSHSRRLPIAQYCANIFTTREALLLEEVPASAAVIGSGATGIELATVWARFGAKVTVLEMLPTIMGLGDEELTGEAAAFFRDNEGMEIRTGASVQSVDEVPGGAVVTYKDAEGTHSLEVEKVLVAAGVVPTSEGLGLEELGVEMTRGYVNIDERMRTNVPGLYAVGDVTGKLALAFTASMQAKAAIADMAGAEPITVDYDNIPRCVFSADESGAVGLSEKQAADRGYEVEVRRGPLVSFDGRLAGVSAGSYKIVADRATGKALGVTLLGADAADRIAGPARLLTLGAGADLVEQVVSSGR